MELLTDDGLIAGGGTDHQHHQRARRETAALVFIDEAVKAGCIKIDHSGVRIVKKFWKPFEWVKKHFPTGNAELAYYRVCMHAVDERVGRTCSWANFRRLVLKCVAVGVGTEGQVAQNGIYQKRKKRGEFKGGDCPTCGTFIKAEAPKRGQG